MTDVVSISFGAPESLKGSEGLMKLVRDKLWVESLAHSRASRMALEWKKNKQIKNT